MLFQKCYDASEAFKETWDNVEKIEASCASGRGVGPHYFVPYNYFFKNRVTNKEKDRIASKVDPVYKLTYKVDTNWRSNGIHPGEQKIITLAEPNSSVEYLLNTIH